MTANPKSPALRRTTRTDMKDQRLVTHALTVLGLDYRTEGKSVVVGTGATQATIDTDTGYVHTDGEWAPTLGKLPQAYAEAAFRADATREGVEIRSRMVDPKTGDIRLNCRMRSR